MCLIALCDDESTELEKTDRLLGDYEKRHSGLTLVIRHFGNTEELLWQVGEEGYMPDLIFMDIYLPGRDGDSRPLGMEAAKKLRGMGYKGKLIFLTTSRDHDLDAFDVDAVQYMVKPVSEEKLFSVLDNLLKGMKEERRRYILLRIEGRHVRVALNDIVCCEAQGKVQYLHLADGTRCILRMTMTELFEQLSGYQQEFARIGAAYIVNLGCINSLNAKEVCMDDGTMIYLPRGTYKNLREQYFNYYCRKSE